MSSAPAGDVSRKADGAPGLRPARGAVTFFVLLLLVGATPMGGALNWMAQGATHAAATPAAVRAVRVERPVTAPVVVAAGFRPVARRRAAARSVADRLLPPPRAPDRGRLA